MATNRSVKMKKFDACYLDPANSGSGVRWLVAVTKDNGGVRFNSELDISDCERTVHISGYGRDGIERMIEKVVALKYQLEELQDALAEASKVYRNESVSKKRKRSKK